MSEFLFFSFKYSAWVNVLSYFPPLPLSILLTKASVLGGGAHSHCTFTILPHLTSLHRFHNMLSCQNVKFEEIRYYPLTALCNSRACVRDNPLSGERSRPIGNKTVSLLCPLLLIIKMEWEQGSPHQSNPCWTTSLCSLIYDYFHVRNDQIVIDVG